MKIENFSVGEIISFGYFMWRILDIVDKRVLLITENVVACGRNITAKFDADFRKANPFSYRLDCNIAKWKRSDFRAYLNGDFLNSFSETENECILNTVVKTRCDFVSFIREEHDEERVDETTDKIFLLDNEEADRYFKDDNDRIAVVKYSPEILHFFDPLPSQGYSQANLEWAQRKKEEIKTQGFKPWRWRLRNTWTYSEYDKGHNTYAGFVDEQGKIQRHYSNDGMRPALWINLEKWERGE
jgi:hypothetical protein